ncbi:unnamed protein product, partial [Mesorhabditis spiculigera]
MRLALISLLLIPGVFSKLGWDGIQAVTVSGFECLKKNGYEFLIARVGRSNQLIDEVGIQNIINARKAGWTDVDGYIYPCTSSSCSSGAVQVEKVINELKAKGAKVGRLWMDIEGTWPKDTKHNQEFIEGMLTQATKMGVEVGMYAAHYDYPEITGNWAGAAKYPLWWANYNGQANLDHFVAFGGWSKPTIHQYKGTTAGPCGVSMDLNYKA